MKKNNARATTITRYRDMFGVSVGDSEVIMPKDIWIQVFENISRGRFVCYDCDKFDCECKPGVKNSRKKIERRTDKGPDRRIKSAGGIE